MADVPYGRGGSPLQNLIARGHKETMLTALRMVKELDAGPVYLKRPLSLRGRAQDIFERMADLCYEMIAEIVRTQPEPTPQTGQPTLFARRTPEMSALPAQGSVEALYDHIRMLDAETYPLASLEHGDFGIEFTRAELIEDTVRAQVVITKKR
jgi:methionyl-tRNA formyltransferase